MTEKYTKARFWKCALQVNPASYMEKYRGADHGMTEEEFNRELLRICLKENIKVVGLADHGNVYAVDAIRNIMIEAGIVVFPGFEIASSEKAHFVCLFPETITKDELNRYLGALGLTNPEDKIWPSNLGGNDLLAKTNELGGIAYAALRDRRPAERQPPYGASHEARRHSDIFTISSAYRVGREPHGSLPLSEPYVRVSPHTAQALDKTLLRESGGYLNYWLCKADVARLTPSRKVAFIFGIVRGYFPSDL